MSSRDKRHSSEEENYGNSRKSDNHEVQLVGACGYSSGGACYHGNGDMNPDDSRSSASSSTIAWTYEVEAPYSPEPTMKLEACGVSGLGRGELSARFVPWHPCPMRKNKPLEVSQDIIIIIYISPT